MKRAFYDHYPATIEAVGNGSIIYRWDIKKEYAERVQSATLGIDEPVADNDIEQYSCKEVVVWETVTANKIVRAAIDAEWGKGIEEKMLNDYNAAKLGIIDESYIDTYKQFLTERKALKEQIDADCIMYNIPLTTVG